MCNPLCNNGGRVLIEYQARIWIMLTGGDVVGSGWGFIDSESRVCRCQTLGSWMNTGSLLLFSDHSTIIVQRVKCENFPRQFKLLFFVLHTYYTVCLKSIIHCMEPSLTPTSNPKYAAICPSPV
ncbi:uncharacterized protein C8R40DRAFT_808415 [Lentinula edodes]|uniref:uncharacterized protein n=1 Tax=Lentinula edodes TaxID=5353 RepID=UPI001E8DD2CC|nr:uncharacterized protein C8R40DRAFT_808415 [Lentinula edodes]KAH7868689.1 hypothetical protein C8R40DRAFT_808415 [Lentinula edodes]